MSSLMVLSTLLVSVQVKEPTFKRAVPMRKILLLPVIIQDVNDVQQSGITDHHRLWSMKKSGSIIHRFKFQLRNDLHFTHRSSHCSNLGPSKKKVFRVHVAQNENVLWRICSMLSHRGLGACAQRESCRLYRRVARRHLRERLDCSTVSRGHVTSVFPQVTSHTPETVAKQWSVNTPCTQQWGQAAFSAWSDSRLYDETDPPMGTTSGGSERSGGTEYRIQEVVLWDFICKRVIAVKTHYVTLRQFVCYSAVRLGACNPVWLVWLPCYTVNTWRLPKVDWED
jgi:hypothetical protein